MIECACEFSFAAKLEMTLVYHKAFSNAFQWKSLVNRNYRSLETPIVSRLEVLAIRIRTSTQDNRSGPIEFQGKNYPIQKMFSDSTCRKKQEIVRRVIASVYLLSRFDLSFVLKNGM